MSDRQKVLVAEAIRNHLDTGELGEADARELAAVLDEIEPDKAPHDPKRSWSAAWTA